MGPSAVSRVPLLRFFIGIELSLDGLVESEECNQEPRDCDRQPRRHMRVCEIWKDSERCRYAQEKDGSDDTKKPPISSLLPRCPRHERGTLGRIGLGCDKAP